MNVLIIPEDFRKDQFILKPLFSGLFRAIGKPRAHIEICKKPLLGGIGEAMKSERIAEVVSHYDGMTDIFILCVDRDGVTNRRQRLNVLEEEFGTGRTFFAENAWEELETWLLAGMDLPEDWRWQDVRAEVSVKENYFNPLAKQRGIVSTPGEGREVLGKEAARNIPAIRQKCPEDFNALAQRLTTFINT
ncbi:MAG: hypothetical protein OXB94_06605 [Nitrospira sp.]|nr:hypothetical protein [Nitrospira sp.]